MVRIRMTHYVSSAPCSWWIIPDIFMWWSRGSLTRHFWHKATLMIPESLSSTRSHSEFGRKHLMSYWLDWMSDICVCVDWWMLFRFVTRSRTSFWRSKWLCHSAPFVSLKWITVWLNITTGLWLTKLQFSAFQCRVLTCNHSHSRTINHSDRLIKELQRCTVLFEATSAWTYFKHRYIYIYIYIYIIYKWGTHLEAIMFIIKISMINSHMHWNTYFPHSWAGHDCSHNLSTCEIDKEPVQCDNSDD